MPVSVIVGGQYGSEGKGKVALEIVRRDPSTRIVVRPGGTNSGHTAYTKNGRRMVLRQLPAASLDRNVTVVYPAGSYIDVALLEREIAVVGLSPSQVVIDPRAHVIRPEHVEWECKACLNETIGSTTSGTGAAVLSRLGRLAPLLPPSTPVTQIRELLPYIDDASALLEKTLSAGERIVIEGTQGYGLSPLHGTEWPKCTSRDTTAAAFLSEAGLSPFHVDEIVLVLRCHPIRVPGDSGNLSNEIDWSILTEEAKAPCGLLEFTSVTNRVRRIGRFEPEVVRDAIRANSPTRVVLNHLDYIDWSARNGMTQPAYAFVEKVEAQISCPVDLVGLAPDHLQDFRGSLQRVA